MLGAYLGLLLYEEVSVMFKFLYLQVYSMRKIIRGRCVIVSNKTFKKPKLERRGTDKDVEKLTELFKQLHFDVIIHKNKKAEVM